MQKELGVPEDNINKIGIAMTETLINSIDYFTSGRGGYAVGIRKNATMPTKVQSGYFINPVVSLNRRVFICNQSPNSKSVEETSAFSK